MEYLGYVKYDGEDVKDGLFDARDAATALIGFAEVFHYFLGKENPELASLKFNLPIKIEKGSWGIYLPTDIADYAKVSLTLAGTRLAYVTLKSYFQTTAQQAAENGLFTTPAFRDAQTIFQCAYQKMIQVVKYVSHVKGFKKPLHDVRFSEDNQTILIPDSNGNYLQIQPSILELVERCPLTLFSRLAELVTVDRDFEIGLYHGNSVDSVKVTYATRSLFYVEKGNEPDDILPDLVDGETVELLGHITRANEEENSIGFAYNNHVITCKPQSGTLADFKNALISLDPKLLYPSRIKIKGIVERKRKDGQDKDRIRLFFTHLEPNEQEVNSVPMLSL